jgi:hypothetical protein
MSCPDVRDLHYGELTGPEQQRILEHLKSCEDCRIEAERLNHVAAMMRDVPAEEPLTRIRFVSDKVFEPKWWQRLFAVDRRSWGWQLAFSLPLWAIVSILLLNRLVPAHANVLSVNPRFSQDARVAQQQSEAQIQKLVDQRVTAAVAKAVAEVEMRHAEQTRMEMAQFRSRYQRDQEQFHQAAYSFYRNLDQKVNRVAMASMEKYSVSAQPLLNAQ